jgi:hypothetical protein
LPIVRLDVDTNQRGVGGNEFGFGVRLPKCPEENREAVAVNELL